MIYILEQKGKKMKDPIERQDIIDLLDGVYHYMGSWLEQYIENGISSIPPAQLEIIRCKDCRWGREACGNIECFADINEPPEYHGYEWFCPNGERRTDGVDC